MKLVGKVAWVTGAGSGIGRASAESLAAEGATVVLTGRREAPLAETAARIGACGLVRAADVADPAAIQAVADGISASFGRLDIVVNSAGVNISRRRWTDLSAEGIDQVVGTNLNGSFYVVTAALPLMRRGGGGVFIHVGSRAGRFWDGPSGVGYIASKAALAAMSHCINREHCLDGIRSTILHPGETVTDILKTRRSDWAEEDLARLMRPEDVGDVVRYIACLPAHVCMAEVLVTPTWNRAHVAALEAQTTAS